MIYLPHLASEHRSCPFPWALQPGDGTYDDFAVSSPFCFRPGSQGFSLRAISNPGSPGLEKPKRGERARKEREKQHGEREGENNFL